MKSYLLTTGTLFGLVTAAHVWRMFVEASTRNSVYIAITALAAALCVWAFRLVRLAGERPR